MINRRAFLGSALSSAGLLVVPVWVPAASPSEQGKSASALSPSGFVKIGSDGSVTVIVGQAELGQGVFTALAAVLAEELDARWDDITVESSRPEAQFGNPFFNGLQITAASTSLIVFFEPYRKAGAQARAMLVEAAAKRLGVGVTDLKTEESTVIGPGGVRIPYGELVTDAARLPIPKEFSLKSKADFRLIGTSPQRADVRPKSTGQFRYGMDHREPGSLVALVAHAPSFGAVLRTFDDSEARKIEGFQGTVSLPSGVAVLATDTWSALKVRNALRLDWDESTGAAVSTDSIIREYQRLAGEPGVVIKKSTGTNLLQSPDALSAEYVVPYLAHLPMEPLNCVMTRREGGVHLEVGTQFQSQDQQVVAGILGLKPEQVEVSVVGMGGGFGRRANPKSDWIADAAHILKARADLQVPIKLLWTREDELASGYYRPLVLTRIAATLDGHGQISAWQQRIIGQSACDDSALAFLVQNGVDLTTVDGVTTMKYRVPDFGVDVHQTKLPIPVQWMRSVGHSHNVFFFESFIDELAHAAGKDPAAFRLANLSDPLLTAVLDRVIQEAAWAMPIGPGASRGISVHEYYGTYVAMVAEVQKTESGFQVSRIVCAVDCGLVVNPDGALAQVESSVVFGLSSALYGEISIVQGRAQQTNLHQYSLLRADRCPQIEVHFLASDRPPGGLGESCVPSVAPAVCNALFALTGNRVRRLPLSRTGLQV